MTSTRLSPEERKNSQFRRVFRWELKHNRLFAGFFAGGMVGGIPIALLLGILSIEDTYTDLSQWMGYTAEELKAEFAGVVVTRLNDILALGAVPLIILFVLCMSVRTFGYLHTRRSVDLYHSIPIRRKPLLMGEFMAVLVSLLAPEVVSFALCAGICQSYGLLADIGAVTLLRGLGLMMLLTAAALALSMFLMVVSGTLLNAALSLAVLAAGWPMTIWSIDTMMGQFLPGYVSVIPTAAYTMLCPFDTFFRVFQSSFFTFGVDMEPDYYFVISLWEAAWWVFVTLALVLAAVLYFCRRKSEYAENNFSFPGVRGAIRMMLSFTVGLVVGYLLGSALESNEMYLVGVVLGAAASHIIFQIVMTRGVRGLWKTIPAGIVTLALLGGFNFVLYEGGLGYATRIPAAEDVASVSFTLPDVAGDESKESYLAAYAYLDLYSQNYEYSTVLYPVFTKTEDIQRIVQLHQSVLGKFSGPYLPFPDADTNAGLSVEYTLKDGRTISRHYYLTLYSGDEEILSSLAQAQKCDTYQSYIQWYYQDASLVSNVNVAEYTDDYSYDATNDELTDEQMQQVWDTFCEELNSASFSNPNGLQTEEEAKALQEQNSGDSSVVDSGSTSEREYHIYMKDMPLTQFSDAMQQQIAEDPTTTGISGSVGSVAGSLSYNVPECCTKTRALIDQLTEANGSYTYYSDSPEGDYATAVG